MTEFSEDPLHDFRERVMADPDYRGRLGSSKPAREAEVRFYEVIWQAIELFGGQQGEAAVYLGLAEESLSRFVKKAGLTSAVEKLREKVKLEAKIAKLHAEISNLEGSG